MCELLGMDCNTPTDIVFSFAGLAARGGRTGPHGDGWGLAFYEGRAARIFLEPRACADSALAGFLRAHPIKTLQAVAHIRQKTRGDVRLANTHPFTRELWGRAFVFAHNGTVRVPRDGGGSALPIGDTDSERAFCFLLNGLRARFDKMPAPRVLFTAIAALGGELGKGGTFNFILGTGDFLFARCDTRLYHLVRQAPFGAATLADDELSVDFGRVTTPRDRVAVVATAPLTVNEPWVVGQPATLWVFRRGRLVATLPSGTPRAPRRRAATPRVGG